MHALSLLWMQLLALSFRLQLINLMRQVLSAGPHLQPMAAQVLNACLANPGTAKDTVMFLSSHEPSKAIAFLCDRLQVSFFSQAGADWRIPLKTWPGTRPEDSGSTY